MYAITGLFLLLLFCVKYLRHYFTDISTPTCVTTSACTNTALTMASRLSLIFFETVHEINAILENGEVVDLVY